MTEPIILVAQGASAGVWGLVAAIPILRWMAKSPAIWSLSLFALSLALYALLDLVHSLALPGIEADYLVSAHSSALTMAALFLFFFSKWMNFQRRKNDLIWAAPTVAVIALIWLGIIGSPAADSLGIGPAFYGPWGLYLAVYTAPGLVTLSRGAKFLRKDSIVRYLKILATILSIASVFLVALINAIFEVTLPSGRIPLLSVLLFIPGAAFLLFFAPISDRDITRYVKRAAVARHQILHAFLVYQGGSLIASRSAVGQSVPDDDIFAAVLEAIQRFMKVSLPTFGGSWLDAIDHGDLKILLERARHCFLVLVTTGREDDLLRGELRDVLTRFEERNTVELDDWKGDPEELEGARDAVNFFFDMDRVF
ncbi:MAG: hypothetical protein GTO63_33615 [Anaerolineae bacterium]|nr:hypothetical protein [Anaerolineae bacterium]NIN99575.1 hypothetical protein [Anaerolineae bacterium]